ncbi:Uncharacterised protein [Halioglobus japonicus]|nr:Uncharacterised protein [Halioglobus japonicus]
MGRALKEKEQPVTEIAIVNTFTKLIFGDEAYTLREQSIIDAFQTMDVSAISGSHTEMGEYLRNLGVREMIQLVSGLQQHLSRYSNVLPRAMHEKEAASPRAD